MAASTHACQGERVRESGGRGEERVRKKNEAKEKQKEGEAEGERGGSRKEK